MSNYGFNFNNLNNLDAPDQNSWFDGSINNSFSSNNASSSLSSNLSANSTSLSGNLCSNFTLDTHQNGNQSNLGSNLNGNQSLLTNGLGNNLSNGPQNGLSNGLASNNNFGNSYYDYQAYNSSSNSSSIALNSEYDYNQQNLVTNLGESNLNSNVIPPFYPTFSQGVKDAPGTAQLAHQLNSHRIDSLIASNNTNLLSSNSSVGSCGSLYQLNAPPINLQATNHHAPFNHVQNSFLVTPNLHATENGFEPYRSPEHSNSPCSYPFDSGEELKYEAFPRQLARPTRAEAAANFVDYDDDQETDRRRKMNNQRERARVSKMNNEFLQLNKTVNKVAKSEKQLTKYETLKEASHIITDLEHQVNAKLQIAKKGGGGPRDPPI